jgi:beta-phosphoglucomutase-like phosphatase (HAD superfamily)
MYYSSIIVGVISVGLCSAFTQKSAMFSEKPLFATSKADYALLFDCDGVIVETEELHRQAYNLAFKSFGLTLASGVKVEWSETYYDVLQNTVGGGKPKMNHYFNTEVQEWPSSITPIKDAYVTAEERIKLVDDLQDAKTEYYKGIIDNLATARIGVLELMDEAIADPNLKVILTPL